MAEMKPQVKNNANYFTIWRWHFYAGMFVAPFLIILACTGLGMVLLSNTVGRDGDHMTIVSEQSAPAPLSTQAKNALDTLPNSTLIQYIAPRSEDTVALFRIKSDQAQRMVSINPYTAAVVTSVPANSTLYHTVDNIHSDLLLGDVGDYLLETAAALTILMILTGWYLWWHKRRSVKAMLLPDNNSKTSPKRLLFRTVHATLGSWVSVVLLFFCISGMAWAGIWGGKVVQAWSQFPAGKWGVAPMPLSSDPNAHDMHDMDMAEAAPHVHGESATPTPTHGEALNHGASKEVPWVLELTPMPQSGTTLGTDGLKTGVPIVLDTVDQFARESGFVGRYQLSLPQGATGVWSISQDSMSYDMHSPTADRTMHLDRYSGKVLADIRYDDYSAFGKFMAAGVALHMGTLGWWSVLANVLFCLSVIAICITGYMMWWQRRPKKKEAALGLNPPARGKPVKIRWTLALPLLVIAAIFPTALIAIIAIALLDYLLISRLPALQRWFK